MTKSEQTLKNLAAVSKIFGLSMGDKAKKAGGKVKNFFKKKAS